MFCFPAARQPWHRGSPGQGQPCVMLPELLSKATVTASDQDMPCHGGISIYGITTYGVLRRSCGFTSPQASS